MTTPNAATRFALLREVFELTREQRRALETDSLERYRQLLEDRESLIADLAMLTDDDAAPLPQNVIVFPGGGDSDRDDAIALDTLIRGILEHDRQNEAMLQTMLDDVRGELQALEHGRRSAAGYHVAMPDSGFIDRVS